MDHRANSQEDSSFLGWLATNWCSPNDTEADSVVRSALPVARNMDAGQPHGPDTMNPATDSQYLDIDWDAAGPPDLSWLGLAQDQQHHMVDTIGLAQQPMPPALVVVQQQQHPAQRHTSAAQHAGAVHAEPPPKRKTSIAQAHAHKRHSQRQKEQLAHLEASHRELLVSYQQLQEEREQLQSRERVLHAAMASSDEMLGMMQEVQQLRLADRASTSRPDVRQQPGAAAATAGAAGSSNSQVDAADTVRVPLGAAQARALGTQAAGPYSASLPLPAAAAVASGEETDKQLPQFGSVEELFKCYMDNAREASLLLLHAEAGGIAEEEASKLLAVAAARTKRRLKLWLLAQPREQQLRVMVLRYANLLTRQLEVVPREHWAHVLMQMRLSAQQKADLLGCRELVGPKLQRVRESIGGLAQQLTACPPYAPLPQQQQQEAAWEASGLQSTGGSGSAGASVGGSGSGDGSSGRSSIANGSSSGVSGSSDLDSLGGAQSWKSSILDWGSGREALLEQLQRQLDVERLLTGQLDHAAGKVVTPIQYARAVVHSLPYIPYWDGMMEVLAEQAGQPQPH